MPTQAQAEEAMCAAVFAGLPAETIILWPNRDVPEDSHPREGTSPWTAFHINHNGGDQHTLGAAGARTFVRTGSVTLQVFVPAGQRGLEDATTLATAARNVFEGETIEGVRFYRVGARTVGRDGAWFQVNVRADFEFDEVK
jgi:hypothetical protein